MFIVEVSSKAECPNYGMGGKESQGETDGDSR